MNNSVFNRNRVLIVTPQTDEKLHQYMQAKFSPCMVPNEPIKGFKIEPIYVSNIKDIK